MADGETVKSLLQQLVSYYRAVWQGAWRDTRQALGADMRLAFVFLISGTVNACGIAYYMGGLGEMGSALHLGSWAFVTLFGTSLTTLSLYLLFYLFFTPSRIYEDNQKEIAELKSQLERRLSLYINIPLVSSINMEKFSALRHLVGGGLVIKLENLVLTNRSKTSRVSLSLTLCVRVDKFLVYRKDIKNPDYLRVESCKESYEGASLGEFLFDPINIAPEDTIRGSMCFLISSEVRNALGLNLLLNHSSCVLEIVDRVSGETMTQNIDQKSIESVESPTAQLVKLK